MTNQNEAEKFLQENSKQVTIREGFISATIIGYIGIDKARKYAELYHASKLAAVNLPSDEDIQNWSDKNYPDDLGQTNVAAKWMRTEASKVIASKDAEIERLKQSVEYWKNENSKTGNSYLKLLSEHNELKSELESIKTETNGKK